ncbi:MAG: tRNA 2-thiouridine(34) synthase MnmA [Oscillospiraceae bacterium]|nr:tRNA 2-thiouridine(34) synthase MnmA [Oscillospiraceae bacterium]
MNKDIVNNKSALVAMSGGVDSTTAALLSIRDGYECEGAVLRLFAQTDNGNADVAEDALLACKQLEIPLHIFDMCEYFETEVISPFIATYMSGRTPNPCVLCNKYLKFGYLIEKMRELGKNHLITGHYARIQDDGAGRFLLKKGLDATKDQSYMLYTLKQEQLAVSRFPLGELTKTHVRELAASEGLKNANKKESQDICFIPHGNYSSFIESYTGQQSTKGRFVYFDGSDLGENNGIIHYTVGQRRGLGLALAHPPYVIEIRPNDNTVVIGKNEQLFSTSLLARDINFIPFDKLDTDLRAWAKIRYGHKEQRATIRQLDNDCLHIQFDEAQRAIAKGQAVVIYDGDVVIGGGTIDHIDNVD